MSSSLSSPPLARRAGSPSVSAWPGPLMARLCSLVTLTTLSVLGVSCPEHKCCRDGRERWGSLAGTWWNIGHHIVSFFLKSVTEIRATVCVTEILKRGTGHNSLLI
jgi:hypothetical protein